MNLLASKLGTIAEELDEFRRDYLLAKAEHERNVAIFKNKLQATEKIPQHRLESLTTENLELYEEYLKLINLSCKLEDAKNMAASYNDRILVQIGWSDEVTAEDMMLRK